MQTSAAGDVGARDRIDQLLLLRALMKKDWQGARRLLASRSEVPEAFLSFLVQNNLRPLLHPLLEASGTIDLFPQAFVEKARRVHAWRAAENERLLHRTAELVELLRDGGVDVIVLKGPLLAIRFYGDIGQRSIADIDLLLRDPRDLAVAERTFRTHGFRRRSINIFGWRLARLFTHSFEYEQNGVKLDVHWALRRHFSFRPDRERLWQRRRAEHVDDTLVHVLCDEDLLSFLITSAFTDIQHGKVKLRAFVDLYFVLRHMNESTDWNSFFATHREERLFRISLNVVEMLLTLLDCRGEFPALVEVLEEHAADLKHSDLDDSMTLLAGSDTSYRNRLWGLSLYEAPLWKSICWSVLAVPVKAAVYRRLPQALRRLRGQLGTESRGRWSRRREIRS